MSAASLVTCTVSASSPTSTVRVPTATRSPAPTGMSERLKILNPSMVTWMV